MTREDLLHAIGTVEESRLARCEKNRGPSKAISEEDTKMKNGKYVKRKGIPKAWLIAAIIAAMVFLMGCAWVIHLTVAESPLFDYPLTESSGVAPERIHLTASEITATSMRITCSIDGVEQDKDAIYILRNGPFTLEKETESGWEMLPEKISDPLKDPDEVLTDGTLEWTVDWSALYGILEPGIYRFTTIVLEGNGPVSATFTLDAINEKSEFGAELVKLAGEILNQDYYYVRFYEMFEFGSFENLTDDEKRFLEAEYGSYSIYEYLKYGHDMLHVIHEDKHVKMGQMYKDGIKYRLDHENDDSTNPVVGWSQWPDMDLENLTWWAGMMTDPTIEWVPQYASDGTLEKITCTSHEDKFNDYYNVEVDHIQVIEFVKADPAKIAEIIGQENVNTSRTFSWEDDQKNMKALDVAFVNTATQPVRNVSEVIARAMAECTVEHDKIIVYRDEEAGMWKVEFQILYGYQGYQYIYMNDDGITQMVSGAGSKVPEWQDMYPDP